MRCALVKNGLVENIVVVDSLDAHPFGDAYTLIELTDTTPCGAGWTFDGSTFAAPPVDLVAYKKAKCVQIEAKTEEVVQRGFLYQGLTFRLLPEDRTNILGLLVSASVMTYPFQIQDIDDAAHVTLTGPADAQAFYAAAMGAVASASMPATLMKQAVMAAATQAAVDAVVDSR